MAMRDYLPLDVPLLKYVGALPGQTVCRRGLRVSVDGVAFATALTRDHARRPLPVWQSCRTLKPGEIFLLNPSVPDSFDGRYFGVLPFSTVTARAVPLWTESAR
jgi:type IV secretory pathway protease TraF